MWYAFDRGKKKAAGKAEVAKDKRPAVLLVTLSKDQQDFQRTRDNQAVEQCTTAV